MKLFQSWLYGSRIEDERSDETSAMIPLDLTKRMYNSSTQTVGANIMSLCLSTILEIRDQMKLGHTSNEDTRLPDRLNK